MLGDSVVGVKHLMDPRGGKPTRRTWALLGAGALLLLLSALAFHAGVANAARNHTARTSWIQELGHPAHTFRPARIGLAYDWMAFGGALGGLLALGVALARLRGERQSPWFRIGTAPEVDFPIHGAPDASFPLVAPAGDGFAVHLAAGMNGAMRLGDRLVDLAELRARGHAHPSALVPGAVQVAIPPGARIRVLLGKSTFTIASVLRPRRQPMPLLASVERRLLAFVGGSAAVHLGIVLLLLSLPPVPRSLPLDLRGSDERTTRIGSAAHEDEPGPGGAGAQDDEPAAGAQGPGAAMALPAGQAGREHARPAADRKAASAPEPATDRIQAVAQAAESGLLPALRAHQGAPFTAITASAHFPSGLEHAHAYAGHPGLDAGDAYGHRAFGQRSMGLGGGGGGARWDTVASGAYGMIGNAPHAMGPDFHGPGITREHVREQVVPQVRICRPPEGGDLGESTPGNLAQPCKASEGDLDKSTLRRHVRTHLPRIRHCYERQLRQTPGIEGTVETEFQISPQGVVLGAAAHGVHEDVARCVSGVIQNIQFPATNARGLVMVRYPFAFRTAGH